MVQVNNMYDWIKHMRKVRRWSSRSPEVLQVRGAELVRARPSTFEIAARPKPVKKEEEEE